MAGGKSITSTLKKIERVRRRVAESRHTGGKLHFDAFESDIVTKALELLKETIQTAQAMQSVTTEYACPTS